MDNARKRQVGFSIGYVLAGLLLVWAAQSTWTSMQATRFRPLPYSEFLQLVDGDKVREVQLRYDTILAELKEGDRVVVGRLPGVDETSLLKELRDHHVVFSGRVERDPWWRDLVFGWLLPLGLLAPFWLFGVRRVGKAGGPLSIGGSRAKIYDATEKERVTFADVAGVDEAKAELSEVVDFLKSPHKYAALGARIPKGVLLVGAPGTGKTLLAKAVAGEAGVPFFSISGSEFIEMFVGVGAARVRDLFEQAKSRAPCIVFIDELDAIGKSRGGIGAMAIHDEREQTLNQLLVEMDGFDARTGVIIMAATNRPEVLDAALLRAGRFDRQVAVDRPDVREREAILRVHAKKLVLGGDVDLALVARATPAMVGADLANVVNEAALAAARRNAEAVDARDFDEAVDRVQLGLKRRRRAMTEEEKRRVAYHEAGHTIVALTVPHADPVHRVTIIPRSIGALGATLQLPASERYLMTRDELCDRICVMMGGRAAEELAFGNVSTGAQNDLERATETARQMVCRFGMSTRLGAQTFGRPAGLRFLETPVAFGEERNFSEATAREIDGEVRRILDDERERAREIVEARRPLLEAIAERLLEKETIERVELEELVRAAGEEERVAMH